jgi:hypothetical protein
MSFSLVSRLCALCYFAPFVVKGKYEVSSWRYVLLCVVKNLMRAIGLIDHWQPI